MKCRRVAVGRVAQAQLALTVPPPARDARVVKDRARVICHTAQRDADCPRVRKDARKAWEGMNMWVCLRLVSALVSSSWATLVPSAVTAVGVLRLVVVPSPTWP